MNKGPVTLPSTSHWRDIAQEVKPRSMSPEGRRRALVRGVRATVAATGIAVAGAVAWQVARAGASLDSPQVARAERIGDHIEAVSDGVLNRDTAWLKRTLDLPAGATLDRIDLDALRARVLAGGQVVAASVVRRFPNTLVVRMAERTPVARVRVAVGNGPARTLLVARDGTVYDGWDYDAGLLGTLPWLAGVTPHDGKLEPIAGMDAVADLLTRARFEAGPLYREWRVISLARLNSDGIIEVRTRSGQDIRFGSESEDFTRQLGRLELVLDTAAQADPPVTLRTIDLSLGPRVPVSEAGPADAAPAPSSLPAPPAQTRFFHLP